jgi:hypothetical protein
MALLNNYAGGKGVRAMGIEIKPSDLQYRYLRKKENLHRPKFAGTPDVAPFDRDDLYEVIPMFEGVMNALGSDDGQVLHRLEEVLNRELPRWVISREEVYDCLLGIMREILMCSAAGAGEERGSGSAPFR